MSTVNDMTVGSPTRGIVHFALPLVCGYILQQLYMVIDAAIVGRFVGVGPLAAVGASSSIMFLIMGFASGCCSGFAIPVAQAFGAKDFGDMRRYVAGAMRLSVVVAAIMTLLTSLLCTPILRMVNTPDAIFADAYTFLLLQFLAIPFTIGYNLLSGFIRALGNSKTPFYILIFSSLVNILLDVVFIVIMHMGVEGVGVATMLAQACSAWLCWRYIRRHMPQLIPQAAERGYDRRRALHLLNNGVPMGLQFSITAIGSIMLQSANNALGTVYVAAFTTSMRVKYLFTCVFENIGVAMATYCGQNIGAGQVARIALGIRSAIKIMLVYFLFTVVVIWPFADEMMMLFVDASQREIIDNAALFMRIANCFYPVLGLLTILRYSIQGLGYSNLSMLSGVMEMLARTAVSLWLVPALGFLGVIYGDPVAWLSADVFLIPAMFFLYRYLKRRHSLSRRG
ncbi:MAG: MATE family efflux transporter [Prevotella sp.]|nr:MATE family efflux transporter [Prevotella sp.]